MAIILFLVLRNGSSSGTQASGATSVTAADIESLAASVGHPVFWLGPESGTTYELTRLANGAIYVRYLPKGVALGTKTPYPTVATYPFAGAYQALQAVAKQNGSTPINVAQGGLAVVSSGAPENVHVAYPGVNYQVEVFDPKPGIAATTIASGKLKVIGNLGSATSGTAATAVTAAGLRAAAKSLGHPIYWLGPKPGYTYELTEPANGAVYVRYLPTTAQVGTATPFMTVATYPFAGAYTAIKALSKQQGAKAITLTHGGLAVVDTAGKKSIHAAFPGVNYQVEVFDPSPAAARKAVTSGQVSSIG